MKNPAATLILWVKAWGDSEGELLVSRAHEANALDLVERSNHVAEIGRVIVVTNSVGLTEALRGSPVILETDHELPSLSFGRKLRSIIEKYSIKTLLYLGGGSGVFMEAEEMARIARAAITSPETLWINNFYSTDFAAFGTPSALPSLSRCRRDNHLGWILGRETGRRVCVLPSTLMTRFDIDTPVDLLILKTYYKKTGRHLAGFLAGLPSNPRSLFKVMDVLTHRERKVLVIGRIPLEAGLFFDRETACHVDFHIEGRGIESREESTGNHSWSLLGKLMERMGISELFRFLSAAAQAVIMDSRVCFQSLGISPSRRDRFYSDLLRPDEIDDPFVQLFTRHALEGSVPFILGGHTLVSGGLYALVESAWQQTKTPLRRGIEDIPEDSWDRAHFEMMR